MEPFCIAGNARNAPNGESGSRSRQTQRRLGRTKENTTDDFDAKQSMHTAKARFQSALAAARKLLSFSPLIISITMARNIADNAAGGADSTET